ncbi:MAG: translation elongation factor G [Deltaproteobacteria bacterium RIFOXYD12_FULL_57_12]|nr:MAG: translation elongation factor G [Deltaproteobacteria bacterium RIFOXYD12_FULL_57_12]
MLDSKMIRNVVLLGHGNCGKTSLAEAMLFTVGKTSRQGRVDDGSSVMDFEPEEVKRRISINSSFHQYSWKKHEVFLIDTPGDDNFVTEAKFAARVADCALFVIGAAVGVKNQTEKFAGFVEERKLPTIIYINKMDRERADFYNVIESAKASLPLNPAVLYLPIGAEAAFQGAVDIIRQKAFLFDNATGKVKEAEVPAEMADDVATWRETLMEQVAETDDELIEKFLEEGALSEAEIMEGLRKGVRTGALCPVCVGTANGNMGTELLLDMINDLLPPPTERPSMVGTDPRSGEPVERKPLASEPFSAQVFKTMADPYAGRLTIFRVFSGTLSGDSFYNASKETAERFGQLFIQEGKSQRPVDSAVPGMIVAVAKLKETVTGDTLCVENAPIVYDRPEPMAPVISYAVSGKKGDEEKLFGSISKMLDEDLTLRLTREQQTKEILLSGVGQVHLEVVGEKIKRKFGVEMELHLPKVPYLETLKGKARVQGKHKKQSGGRGQFADTWIEIEPMPRGSGFVFEDKIVGGVIPRQYIPAVEKGIIDAMALGVIAGYPVVDVKVALVDGSFHAVDSSEMAFKIAGSLGFKKAAAEAKPILLEPIMNVSVRIPEDCVGDVMGDLNGRRGRVMGMDSGHKCEVINAQVPMVEVLKYAPDLTSMTGGRGTFSVSFSHYEEVPAPLAEKIIAEANIEK